MTPNEKPLEPHQKRVVDEKVELDFKRDKLFAFTKGEVFQKIDADEQMRLMRQLAVMDEYSHILSERISHF